MYVFVLVRCMRCICVFGRSGAGYVCMGKVCERERERRGDEGCSVCKKLGGVGMYVHI